MPILGRHQPRVGEVSPTLARAEPRCGRTLPRPNVIEPTDTADFRKLRCLAQSACQRTNLSAYRGGPHLPDVVEIRRNRPQFRRHRATFGRLRASFGRHQPGSIHTRSNRVRSDLIRATLDGFRPKFEGIWPTPANISRNPGLIWLGFDRCSVGQHSTDVIQAWSDFNQILSVFDRSLTTCDRIRPNLAGCGQNCPHSTGARAHPTEIDELGVDFDHELGPVSAELWRNSAEFPEFGPGSAKLGSSSADIGRTLAGLRPNLDTPGGGAVSRRSTH